MELIAKTTIISAAPPPAIKVKFLTLKFYDTLKRRGLKQINQYAPLVSEGPSMTKSEIMDTV